MKESPRIDMVLDEQGFRRVASLFAGGVQVAAPVGCDLDTFFCRCLGLDPDYAATRVRTVFLNGRPVDDTSRAVLAPGDEVALSTAMPGLVGICMRRDSPIKSFRRDISHDPAAGSSSRTGADGGGTGLVTVKLFNFIALEAGPLLLARGVYLSGERLARAVAGGPGVLSVTVDGRECDAQKLCGEARQAGEKVFFLRATEATKGAMTVRAE
ncbi:hypothetical protein [Desulfolutivibrio sulfoxidireducens]|uniref:hypothetical protein n=1 Tax=Desulfolutivibrio sulfoxidireducens TaxID=2773299 RepID=UPI00159DC0CE|nr:hypothetical protein [Desulfolutivibrio sulfoxidireducens]QLA15549.1 hypothetical protein GD605_05035 [Desulfolutivibrio sulfoxidireducens]